MAGWMKHEGQAVDVVAPTGLTVTKGELYRIDGWSGIAMRSVTATDTDRKVAFETGARIWYFTIPSGLTANRGDVLFWQTGTGLKVGATDLTTSQTGNVPGVVKVEEARDSNQIIAGRIYNN